MKIRVLLSGLVLATSVTSVTLAALTAGCASFEAIQSGQSVAEEKLRNIRFGQSTRDDVARLLGQPVRKLNFANLNDEVWDYRYASGIWYMLLSVHFDSRNGVVSSYFTDRDPEMYSDNDSTM